MDRVTAQASKNYSKDWHHFQTANKLQKARRLTDFVHSMYNHKEKDLDITIFTSKQLNMLQFSDKAQGKSEQQKTLKRQNYSTSRQGCKQSPFLPDDRQCLET